MAIPTLWRWLAGLALSGLVTVVPVVFFRYEYTHSKRLREVVPGKVYRSGQMTAPGFREAVARLKLRTIVNLQDEYEDPEIDVGFFTSRSIREKALCDELGVRYVYIAPDLVSRRDSPAKHPRAIEQFLAVMDDPANYPVLIHCHAGLHRTGSLTAVYRMEYQGWGPYQAIREMKANGFGPWVCTSANDYITQYVLTYRPRNQQMAEGRSRPLGETGTGDRGRANGKTE